MYRVLTRRANGDEVSTDQAQDISEVPSVVANVIADLELGTPGGERLRILIDPIKSEDQ